MSDLLEFQAPAALVPPGASPLLGAILLAIDVADSVAALGRWWLEHQEAIKRLAPTERAAAMAAKDAAKARLPANH